MFTRLFHFGSAALHGEKMRRESQRTKLMRPLSQLYRMEKFLPPSNRRHSSPPAGVKVSLLAFECIGVRLSGVKMRHCFTLLFVCAIVIPRHKYEYYIVAVTN